VAVGGIEWEGAGGVLKAMHAWTLAGSGLTADKVVWGQQASQRPEAPAIIMRISNISELGPTWVMFEHNAHTFADITVTADDGTNLFTAAAHNRLTGDGPVQLESSGTVPGNTATLKDYWVVRVDANTFRLAESFQDAMAAVPVTVDLTSNGTGTIRLVDTPTTVRQGQELKATARGIVRVTLELRCHAEPIIGANMAVALLQRVRTRREWPSQMAILEAANIGLEGVERILAVTTGKQDDFLYEPRAVLLVYLTLAVEESEYLTIIERVTGTNEIPDPDVAFDIP
jgi:hypothetical protein